MGAPSLPSPAENVLGKQVQFNIQLSSNGKPQAIDVTLSEEVLQASSEDAQTPAQDYGNLNKVVLVSAFPAAWTVVDLEHYFSNSGSVDSVSMLPGSDRSACVVFLPSRKLLMSVLRAMLSILMTKAKARWREASRCNISRVFQQT